MAASPKGLTAAVEGGHLVLSQTPPRSATRKTLVVSSHGNQQTGLEIDGGR